MMLLKILKNKYFIITVVFGIWVIFFAQYDILSLRKQKAELKEMKEKIDYLQKEVERLNIEKNALKTNPDVVEKVAREKYFMKTANEDVFMLDTVIIPKTPSKN